MPEDHTDSTHQDAGLPILGGALPRGPPGGQGIGGVGLPGVRQRRGGVAGCEGAPPQVHRPAGLPGAVHGRGPHHGSPRRSPRGAGGRPRRRGAALPHHGVRGRRLLPGLAQGQRSDAPGHGHRRDDRCVPRPGRHPRPGDRPPGRQAPQRPRRRRRALQAHRLRDRQGRREGPRPDLRPRQHRRGRDPGHRCVHVPGATARSAVGDPGGGPVLGGGHAVRAVHHQGGGRAVHVRRRPSPAGGVSPGPAQRAPRGVPPPSRVPPHRRSSPGPGPAGRPGSAPRGPGPDAPPGAIRATAAPRPPRHPRSPRSGRAGGSAAQRRAGSRGRHQPWGPPTGSSTPRRLSGPIREPRRAAC